MGSLNPNIRMTELASLDRGALREDWERTVGKAPPPHLSIQFMRKVLMHDAKLHRSKGYSAETKRVLAASLSDRPDTVAQTKPKMRQGAQLVREWNGRKYQVAVTDGGYMLDGKAFKSLSAVAYHITGARWSGPRFFGITNRKGKS